MVDFDKIVDFVNNVFGSNTGLANETLKEFGIDPKTRRPTQYALDSATTCPHCNVPYVNGACVYCEELQPTPSQ